MSEADALSPGEICQRLLLALSASDGRRKRRKRNTAPDAIGLDMKLRLLERAAEESTPADDFEAWLAQQCLEESEAEGGGEGSGARWAVALEILEEWRMAQASPAFRAWLLSGAPSDDASE